MTRRHEEPARRWLDEDIALRREETIRPGNREKETIRPQAREEETVRDRKWEGPRHN